VPIEEEELINPCAIINANNKVQTFSPNTPLLRKWYNFLKSLITNYTYDNFISIARNKVALCQVFLLLLVIEWVLISP
jgi:hypothetical protein